MSANLSTSQKITDWLSWFGQRVLDLRDYSGLIYAYRQKSCPSSMPLLYLDLTKTCNLQCAHCGFASHYPDDLEPLTTEQWLSILDQAVDLKTRIVSFGGGEPFLFKEIFTLLERAKQNGFSVHINTNGTCLNESMVKKLAELGEMTLVVSLDHPEAALNDAIRGEGVFRRVRSAIRLLNQSAPDIKVGINCVIGPHNLGKLSQMIRLGHRWAVQSVKFTPAHGNLNHSWRPNGLPDRFLFSPSQLPALRSELKGVLSLARKLGIATNSVPYLRSIPDALEGKKQIECYAGFVYGNVDPYGRFFGCYDHIEPLNLHRKTLKEAWCCPAMQHMRRSTMHCAAPCWNTGNIEPSLRMSPGLMLRHPFQLFEDLHLYG